MRDLYLIASFLLCGVLSLQAQEAGRVMLKGKVVSSSTELGGISVVNLKADLATSTETGGYFAIPAKEGDTLMFSAVHLKAHKMVVRKPDLEGGLIFVKIEILQRQLDEVKVNEYKNINAVSLGILSKPAKKYTPAERKLRTAGELHWYSPLLIPVGGMSVDGLINSISGRTAMLKKELLVERKETLLKKVTDQFEEAYFTDNLLIPSDHVKAFQYYLIEDTAFATALNNKNITMATFLMNRIAAEYLDMLKGK